MRVQVEEPALRTSSYLWAGSLGALAWPPQTVMVLFLTYFLLLSDDLFKRKLVKHRPDAGAKKITSRFSTRLPGRSSASCWCRSSPAPSSRSSPRGVVVAGRAAGRIWGLVAGVLNSIPYFGPLIVTAGLAVVGFLQFGTIE